VRTLLGIDPSPGALFAEGGGEAPAAADPRAPTSNSRTLRPEASIALAAAAAAAGGSAAASLANLGTSTGGGGVGSAGGGSSAATRQDALEEARLAAEQIVIPQGQPVELLPRGLDCIDLQVQVSASGAASGGCRGGCGLFEVHCMQV
jgi:hypothetical protein